MNASARKVAEKRAQQERLAEIVQSFRASEGPMIEAGKTAFGDLLRDAIPRLQGYALEANDFVGRMTVDVEVHLGPDGKKSIILRGMSQPPPWKLEASAPVTA